MDKNKQLIAIAEYCGYKNLKHIDAPDCLMADGVWADNPKHPPHVIPRIKVPDYLNDLNAMHEAEETFQTHYLCYEFNNKLYNILGNTVGNRADKPHHWTWHATAEQRAEAFLKTIGKWEDDSICFKPMHWKCKDE